MCVVQEMIFQSKIIGGWTMVNELKKIVGKELKYKQLCEELNLKIKGGDSKKKQLKEIGLYCNLVILSKPTRYIIQEVYEKELLPINGNNKFQEPIEDVIIQLLRVNDFGVLYMTNTQLLMSLYMVNNNYKVLKIPKLRKALEKATGEDYYGLYMSANKSGEILTKWFERTLVRMEERKLISYHKGYCLFKEIKNKEYSVFQKFEVPRPQSGEVNSMESRIGGCYNQVLNSLGFGKSGYIPPEFKGVFNERFNNLIREEFDGEYDGAYKVKIIVPYDPKRVKRFSEGQDIINTEAQRKIKDTKQLDYLTGVERKRLLDEIIAINPSVEYRELIKEGRLNDE